MPGMLEVKENADGVTFAVRVQPRASRDAIAGEHAGALRLRVTSPPVDDRANQACRRLLAEHLNIPVSAVRIVAGERSRSKRIAIRGVPAERIRELGSITTKR
jgi:hypothetical protein